MLAGPDFLVLDRFEYEYRDADYKYRDAEYGYRDAEYGYQKKHEPCGASKSPPVPS